MIYFTRETSRTHKVSRERFSGSLEHTPPGMYIRPEFTITCRRPGESPRARITRRIAKMRADVPVRSAEGAVVGEAGSRAAGRKGLQGPRHVVAIQRRNAGAAGAI